ncbi:MAG: DNRLRE domain-containing protein [Clostridia bacterium]|nr:DNRLRE domain-containing protein [Clostridia bacterium]
MSQTIKRMCRIIAFVMSFVLLVFFIPLQGLPALADTSPAESTTSAVEETENAPVVLGEDTSRREENIKHFFMSDHTSRAVIYSTPVHYLKEGEWTDIDNTLIAQAATAEDDVNGQIATGGPFTVKFANNLNSSKLVRIDKENYRLSWNYVSKTKRNVTGNVKARVEGTDPVMEAVSAISSSITYDYFEENASLNYEVSPTGIKENIILHSAADTYSYTFEFKTKGVSLVAGDDGGIKAMANDTGEVVFVIPAPYMIDSAGRISTAVSYELSSAKNKAILTITADPAWVNSEETTFPVIIDPIITTEQDREEIDSAFIASDSEYASTNFSTGQSFRSVGYDSYAYGKTRTLVKFNLPALNKGDMVVGANLAMRMWHSSFVDGANMQVNAHTIGSSWSASSVTWNNQPSLADSLVNDYCFITDVSAAPEWRYFDITRSVKQWYEGSIANNGIMLKTKTETDLAVCWFGSEIYTSDEDIAAKYPVIIIDYRNNRGLEDYWTYTAAPAGTAGTMYVNDYTGNPVFVAPLFTSPSQNMPLSMNLVYNGYISNINYNIGHNHSSKSIIGTGWRLSVHQTVLSSTKFNLTGEMQEKYPYVYTDADGTDHYFVRKVENGTTTFLDEDGLGLKLTIPKTSVSYYTISDKEGNKLRFNSAGNLKQMVNANGQTIDIAFLPAGTAEETGNMTDIGEGEKIDYIVDGSGYKYTFNYSNSNNVQSITDPFGRKMYFYRNSNGTVRQISYYGGTVANFTYETTSPLSMLTVTDDADYRLGFTYTTLATGKRVSRITEYSAADSAGNRLTGQIVSFDRSKYNTTVIRVSGKDDVYGNSDDMQTICQFDNLGRLTSTMTRYMSGTSTGASSARYTDYSTESTAALKNQNRVVISSAFGRNVVNFTDNGNVESMTGWTPVITNATSTVAASSTYAYFGKKSIKINNTAIGALAGRADFRQTVTGLNAGNTYTFSAYVKTTTLTSVYSDALNGVYLSVSYDSGGIAHTVRSKCIDTVNDTAIDNGWRRLSVTFDLPSDSTSVRTAIALRNMTGTAYVDGIQLEQNTTAHPVNLIQNCSFEKETSEHLPSNWTATNITYSTYDSIVTQGITHSNQIQGTASIRMGTSVNSNKYLSQSVAVSGDPNETYILSGWMCGTPTQGTNHENCLAEIYVAVNYKKADGTTYSETKPAVKFNTAITGWQYASQVISLVSSQNASDTPTSILVRPRSRNQANFLYFDWIQLIRDNANTYTYDDEGNLISTAANAEQKSTMEYDGPDMTSATDALGYDYNYTYDAKHNLLSATSAGDVTTTFTYNTRGQATSSVVKSEDETLAFKSDVTYTGAKGNIQAGAQIASVVDADNKKTTYTYDGYARTSTITSPSGNKTTNTYVSSTNDRLSSVTVTDAANHSLGTVSYTYDGDRLDTLSYGSDTYSFEVDRFGNTLSTSVNGHLLSSNTYAANNGKLKTATYGNGDVRTYSYSWLGQIATIGNGTNTLFNYTYDSGGTLQSFTDLVAGRKFSYSYDSINRPIQTLIQSTTGTHIGMVEFGYDGRNNLTKLAVEYAGHTHSAKYLYSAISGKTATERYAADNLPTRYLYTSVRYADYSYDGLNRLTARTFSTETPLTNTYSYYRSDRNTGSQTLYQTTLLEVETINDAAYRYTYDEAGNIIEIEKGEVLANGTTGNFVDYASYEYDALGQLIRENFVSTNQTTHYTYDGYGNRLSRKVYNYTDLATENLSTLTHIHCDNYGYGSAGDAPWAKPLRSVSTEAGSTLSSPTGTITYDEIGNPVSYLGATLGWQNGRQLSSYSKGNTAVAYTYDDNGMRTSKTVNGVKSEYLYIDGQLHGEIRDGRHIHYSYDSYGNLSAIKYYYNADDDTRYVGYYVATNARGDVVGIYNPEGAMVVSYEYDAWGNLINMTDTTSVGIGTVNPIRYRGYFYDAETGLYYASSRYYDPQIGRFINADNQISGVGGSILGNNMFTYCMNNPVNMSDPTGNWPKWIETAANWVNKNIIQPVKNFFFPSSSVVVSTANNLPPTGEPGSSQTLPNPDGTPKQKRWYGPDGNAVRDRDYNHPGKDIPFPHDHEWKNGQRQKDHLPPSPDYEFSLDPVLGVGLVTICVVGIVVVAADDATGIGVADDFLFGPLGTGVGEGLILIFG